MQINFSRPKWNLSVPILIVCFFGLILLFYTSKNLPQQAQSHLPLSSQPIEAPICSDHYPDHWHPPVQKDSTGKIICAYGHEHGDAPPEWVEKAGFEVGFDQMGGFMANTSDMENNAKHAAMKGFTGNIQGVDIYARIHLASNPLDRVSRYHSYELFIKDKTGAISHFQGWLNTGDPAVDRIPYHDSTYGQSGIDPGRRPIVWAATRHACQIDRTWCFEIWSMTTSPWGPDIVWGIDDPTTYFQPGEKYDTDITHWDQTGKLGGDRTISLTLFRDLNNLKKRGINQIPTGKIWATQFGDIVTGPNDPVCLANSLKFGVSYQNICLENFIASTLSEISGTEISAQKSYDLTGVVLPN